MIIEELVDALYEWTIWTQNIECRLVSLCGNTYRLENEFETIECKMFCDDQTYYYLESSDRVFRVRKDFLRLK